MSLSKWVARVGPVALVLVLVAAPAVADQPQRLVPSDFGVSGAPFAPRHTDAVGTPNAVQNLTTMVFYSSLSAAVAAASAGDILEVNDLVLPEGQVLIDKSLTIRGATGAEEFQATVDTGTSGDARGWFVTAAGVDVTIQDLSFDGTGFLIFQAIRVNGTGTFSNLTFNEIKYNPSGPQYAGTGIATANVITVNDCTFTEMGRVGVLLFGSTASGSVVDGLMYTGKGAGAWLDYGVEIGGGAHGTVRHARATNNYGTGTGPDASAGLMVTSFFDTNGPPDSTGSFESCDVWDNAVGIAIGIIPPDVSYGDIKLTRFFDNTVGLQADLDAVVSTAENNWWGCNEGPGAADCDSIFGPPGIDSDPWLVLTLEPDSAVVEQGDSTNVTQSLTSNSDGADTSGMGTVIDGIDVAFGTDLGSVAPLAAHTASGESVTVFTAPMADGTANVSTTVDNETVSTPIDVTSPAGGEAIPMLDSVGILVFVLLIAAVGGILVAFRRRA